MNYLLTLAYDGTNYCGFQVQPNGRSVAAAFQDALEAVLGYLYLTGQQERLDDIMRLILKDGKE